MMLSNDDDDDHLNDRSNPNDDSGDNDEPDNEGEDHPEKDPSDDGSNGQGDEPPFEPIEPSDLGLPPDPKRGYIPSDDELRDAAARALDDIAALFLLHKDNEQIIADQLKNVASILLAASQLKGPHQTKAVKLGLQLNHRFWQAHNKEDAWLQLIMPLLNTALEVGDKQLQAEAYRAWGIYLYTSGKDANQPRSARAFEIALEYAAESGYDDLKLLARVEHFNQQIVGSKNEQDTLAEAQALLAEARRLQDIYFEGRVYLSLARFYHLKVDYHQVFHYAQQAMIVFWTVNDYGLLCQSIAFLIGSLYGQIPQLSYRQKLLNTMEQVISHIAYPYISAAFYCLWAQQYYYLKLYEEARAALIKAWLIMRTLGTYREASAPLHTMGLIEMRRHRWKLSQLFLETAQKRYQKAGDQVQVVHIAHALAFIPFEQKDFATAYTELCKVLEMAEALPPGSARDWLLTNVRKDAERAKQAMQSE